MASEPHPEIHIIPIQSTPARKHSPILGSMASTHRRNDPTDRMGEPPGVRGLGQNCPPTAGLASRDGCQGQARARERGLNRHQGPRSSDSNDRARHCPPPQDVAILYHGGRARQHRSMLSGFSWSRPPRSGLRGDIAPDSLVSSAVVDETAGSRPKQPVSTTGCMPLPPWRQVHTASMVYVFSDNGTIKPSAQGRVFRSGRAPSVGAFPCSDAGDAPASWS